MYALALDGAKRPCKVRTSNAGHVLASGIARPDRAERVADALMHTGFYSGWGIRTVAYGEARYNPMSYHNGSIWPHDNALIVQGMARYGRKGGTNFIFDGLVRATTYMEHRRIPELYCGFRRRPGRGPTLYPAACSPQAWAAGAPFMMLQAMLGLEFDLEGRRIVLVDPYLPASAGTITVRNLALGDGRIDFAVWQDGRGRVSAGIAQCRRSADLPAVWCKRQALARAGSPLAGIPQARSLHLLQGRIHLMEQVVVGLGDGALRDHALKPGLLLLDASLKVLDLFLGWVGGWMDGHRTSPTPPAITTPAAAMCSLVWVPGRLGRNENHALSFFGRSRLPMRFNVQVIYELAPVIADVISAHCQGTRARADFVRACLLGDWDDAKVMVEGMLAEPWHLQGYQETRLREFLELVHVKQGDLAPQ